MAAGAMDRRALLAAGLASAATAPALAAARGGRPLVAITTGKGVIAVALEDRRAPLTAANFLRYVDSGKYDGGTFYRAARTPGVAGAGTVVGGPKAGTHPFAPIAHEPTTQTGLRHRAGTLSLGRFAPGSATADFFICASDEPYLDAHPGAKGDNLGYAAFGEVVSGMGVVRRILAAPTGGVSPFPDQKGQWLTHPVPILHMARAG